MLTNESQGTEIHQGSEPVNDPATPVAADVQTPVTPAPSTPSGSVTPPPEGAAAAPVYQPNYKFKVMDEEKEFDEFLRGAIKDQETEKKIRELYEKAHGLDFVKPKLLREREQRDQYQKELGTIKKDLSQVMAYRHNGDYESFLQALGIPEVEIFKWVKSKLDLQEMSPEQRQVHQRSLESQRKAMTLEQQYQQLQEEHQQVLVSTRTRDLDSVLARPDVTATAKAFDTRVGRPGAFRERVIREGITAYQASGRDITPEEAVSEVLGMLGGPIGSQLEVPGQPGVAAKKPPVIPNVGGKSTSPVKKSFKTVDDLVNFRKEKYGI